MPKVAVTMKKTVDTVSLILVRGGKVLVERRRTDRETYLGAVVIPGGHANSTTLKQGDEIFVVIASKERIKVEDGNRYTEIFEPIEATLGKPLTKNLKGYLKN